VGLTRPAAVPTAATRVATPACATGLGAARLKKESKPEIRMVERVVERTGTDNVSIEHINYEELDAPAVMRRGRREMNATVAASIDTLEIPAFLRKQAD
jgi:cell division protein FtsZ